MLEIGRNFTEIKKLKIKYMNISLCQSELNELIYALGIAQVKGTLIRKDIATRLEKTLRDALDKENERIEQQIQEDEIRRELSLSRKYAFKSNY
jgi:hypothetical protein